MLLLSCNHRNHVCVNFRAMCVLVLLYCCIEWTHNNNHHVETMPDIDRPSTDIDDTLETVHFQLFRLSYLHLGQERADVVTLIALQLYNLAILGVFNHSAIASEFLLASLDYLLLVITVGNALHCGQRFPSVPLLDADVD